MGKRMLIDAAHPEEARVAILSNDSLEEFDFETTTKKQLKGNIYLAKVIRIEPSLQAAFVEFGGNRHGFLAFSEIHPDYYRIPIEDREALMAPVEDETALPVDEPVDEIRPNNDVEILGGEDVEEIETRPHRARPSRQYKIQEVIKRRQIMLVQVTKEERGGKGAAITTYLSLAGRYCVLMPNAAKGGGISRKITNVADRKRLREIIESIQLPETMSLIIRTAGMSRSKIEIKKDCDYLMGLWNEIRENTLHSIAPALIYEESDLIKRAIRDYYSRDVDEIWIEGEPAYKDAREFIRKLMPSHTKKVKLYNDDKIPLFNRYGVERQIDTMHNPVVQLRSGGYIVFGTTEALVAIDVNSGKATRERHIEETAFKTNLEAAEEVARQLRLRDLAGLIVIDFIDMDENRNIEAVERRLKDAMRHDRARVQVGRISAFGLLELSRQRLRPNIIESTSLPCPSCRGTGMIRSVESSSLHVIRAIEEEAIQQKASELVVYVPTAIALYVLNQKRKILQDMETRWKISLRIAQDDTLIPPDYRIERSSLRREVPLEVISGSRVEEEDRVSVQSPQASKKSPPSHPGERDRLPKVRRHDIRARPSHPKTQKAPPPSISGEENAEILVREKQIIEAPSEAHSQSAEPKGEASHSPRRRFRKFDRRTRPKREETQGGQAQHEAAPPSELVPQQPIKQEESAPPARKQEAKGDKIQRDEKSKQEDKPAAAPTPQRKKAATRKGWWQRLME
ncbi:MAG TPA: Rne/Rng family ribonuclease [Alphaproteobacteria bacterium]|nr:Rne/Rng family ribonuclease [Alphaproteobacteria bacterium]